MSDHQQPIIATTGDKTSVEIATTTSASTVNSEEEGIEVIGVHPSLDHNTNDNTANAPSMIDTLLTNNNNTPSNKLKAQLQDTQVPIRRNSSPRSLMDFDVMATNSDDNANHTHMNHSHDAFEIQRKTLAMRELDLLLGHVVIDDEEEEKEASFVIENNNEPLQTVNETTEQQQLSTLFSCTMDDIDEVVQDIVAPLEDIATPLEELISPFHRITDLLSCRGVGGGCMVELEEEGVGCRLEVGEAIGK